jgi:putative ABC transport system ATP-binding protein
MILQAESVFKSYPSAPSPLEILKGVSLQVEPGDTIAIVGRSGSGKSTLLSLLAGLDTATQGRISIDGLDWTQMSEDVSARMRSEKIGLIFQQFHLLPHLTAYENIRLPVELTMHRPDQMDRAHHLLEAVGLAHRSHHYPHQLSRGECQRVAIARALVLNPRVLLADEPTASLDDETALNVSNLLLELPQRQGTALLIATHDIDLARRCKIIFRMVQGQLQLTERL